MFLTGPDVIKTVTHENVTKEELGGADTHNSKSGVAHFAYESDTKAVLAVRELLLFSLQTTCRIRQPQPVLTKLIGVTNP